MVPYSPNVNTFQVINLVKDKNMSVPDAIAAVTKEVN